MSRPEIQYLIALQCHAIDENIRLVDLLYYAVLYQLEQRTKKTSTLSFPPSITSIVSMDFFWPDMGGEH